MNDHRKQQQQIDHDVRAAALCALLFCAGLGIAIVGGITNDARIYNAGVLFALTFGLALIGVGVITVFRRP